MKFNRWSIISLYKKEGKKTYFQCACECGNTGVVRKDQLTRGISKSCGCWKREVASKQITALSTTHGQANKTKTYSVWKGIRKRCSDKNDKDYGGRGIKICKRWDNYVLFLKDMGECPEGMTIDRKDNNGDYEPKNCRWTDKLTQSNNTRANIFVRNEGELITVPMLARKVGIDYHTLWQRLFRLGWSVKDAIKS